MKKEIIKQLTIIFIIGILIGIIIGLIIGYIIFSVNTVTIEQGDIGSNIPDGDLIIPKGKTLMECWGTRALYLKVLINGKWFADSCAHLFK